MTVRPLLRGLRSSLKHIFLRQLYWQHSRKRRAVRAVVYGLCGYGAVLGVMLCLENFLLFRASGADDWSPPPPGVAVRDVALTSRDGTAIHGWWSAPSGWRPEDGAVLLCHGNGGNLSHRGGLLRLWHEQFKMAVLLFDYPGFGRSGGSPSEAGCYAAGDAAYDWITDVQKVLPSRLLLYGGSLGGAVATDLATRRPHRALVLVSAFTSFPDMAQKECPVLPARWLVRNQFDNEAKIGHCLAPVFIAHGMTDALIPFSQGRRLFAAARGPKQFFAMTDYHHSDSPDAAAYPVLHRFLAEVAPPAPPLSQVAEK